LFNGPAGHGASGWRGLLLAAAALSLSLPGCERAEQEPPYNVVFLVIDAAAASHLSCYGAARYTTPNIDRLAEDGVLFERAYAQAAWALPSAASYFTGLYPPKRGEVGRAFLRLPLAVLMIKAGLRTAAFSENPYVTREFGMDKGFEVFEEYFPFEAVQARPASFERIESRRTVEDVRAWLDGHGQERFFLYVHFLPPHAPYDPPPPFNTRFETGYEGELDGSPGTLAAIGRGEIEASEADLDHLRALYDENLAFADHLAGQVIGELRERGLYERSLIILASDHGEAFGEHGRMQHNSTVYEEMVRVPLIIRFPDALGPFPPRWEGVVELTGVLPTVCELLDVPVTWKIHGRSLAPALRGEREQQRVARSWTSMTSGNQAALRLGPWKLIQNLDGGRTELYDLSRDPSEQRNLAAVEEEIAARLKSMLEETELASVPIQPDSEIDEDTLERLRSLGYVQ